MKLTKISAKGAEIPADATEWVAVRLDHDLLARPLYFDVAEHEAPNWKAAMKWMEKRETCGWQWRAPTVEELFLLADRTKFDPCLDGAFFPEVKSDWYWASTLDVSPPSGCAWLVYFGGGYSDRSGRDGGGWCRAVRAGQY